jgi:hypothetical protein
MFDSLRSLSFKVASASQLIHRNGGIIYARFATREIFRSFFEKRGER